MMKNIFYVIYDNDKNVTGISREFNDGDNYFPIEAYKVRDFILGTKSFGSYYVKHDGLDRYILEEKKFEKFDHITNDIFEVQNLEKFNDLVIEHNLSDKKWRMFLSQDTKECIVDTHLDKILKFYICLKEQHNFLIRTLECSLREICEEKEFSFISDLEHDCSRLKIFTKRYFIKIGITNV